LDLLDTFVPFTHVCCTFSLRLLVLRTHVAYTAHYHTHLLVAVYTPHHHTTRFHRTGLPRPTCRFPPLLHSPPPGLRCYFVLTALPRAHWTVARTTRVVQFCTARTLRTYARTRLHGISWFLRFFSWFCTAFALLHVHGLSPSPGLRSFSSSFLWFAFNMVLLHCV